jgi:hypothetical protein
MSSFYDFLDTPSLFVQKLDKHPTFVQFLRFIGHTIFVFRENGHTFATCPILHQK